MQAQFSNKQQPTKTNKLTKFKDPITATCDDHFNSNKQTNKQTIPFKMTSTTKRNENQTKYPAM